MSQKNKCVRKVQVTQILTLTNYYGQIALNIMIITIDFELKLLKNSMKDTKKLQNIRNKH